MKTFLVALPVLLLAGAAAAQEPQSAKLAPERIRELRQAGAEVLFWSQEQRDANFPVMETIFPTKVIKAGGAPRPLPEGRPLEGALGGAEAVDAYMAAQNVAGLIVLQDGKVRLERYARSFGPEQRWTSWSVAKSLTSSMVGAAVKDGHIRSLDDPVTRYIPELAGTAYDGVNVRQLLTMTSGVKWNEDYTDPESDVARMLLVPIKEGEDVTVAYMKTLGRDAEPGKKWAYKTGETNLVGVLVSRATGKPLADYLSEKIWRPYGMERDAAWMVGADMREIGGCCISASLRDYARIGQFMLDGGVADGRQVLPEGWIAEATAAAAPVGPGRGYGYQWWTGEEGAYSALGIFGQMVSVDPARKLVVVTLSAWPQATGRELSMVREGFIRKVKAAVDAEAAVPVAQATSSR